MSDDVQSHPAVAELAASLKPGPPHSYPPEALDKMRKALRAAGDDTVVTHLLALGVKVHRVAGAAGQPLLTQIATLAAEALGSMQAVADGFANAGMSKDAASAIGANTPTRAPNEKRPAGLQVKARRGLSKP